VHLCGTETLKGRKDLVMVRGSGPAQGNVSDLHAALKASVARQRQEFFQNAAELHHHHHHTIAGMNG